METASSSLLPEDMPMFTTTSNTYSQEAYLATLDESEAVSFLQDVETYDASRKRWSFPSSPEVLCKAVQSLVRSVISRFIRSKDPGVNRNILSTKNTPGCGEENEDGYRVCPLLVIRAAGPSFEVPNFDNPFLPEHLPLLVGFTNMASYVIARTEEELGNDEDILRESASYSRYFFAQQPNRVYVRSLVVTENYARLVHIDRSGAQITPPIDIHREPATLVRVVAGLCSTNERLLGLDDTVQWTIVNGRKTQGTLTTTGPSGEPKTYDIVEAIPVPRDSVLGRGTTCWRVRDPESLEEYVVKDAWRPDGTAPEHELLGLVKGVPGVVQMMAHEAGRGEIKDFRCPTTHGQYINRIASRTTTKAYGKSIVCFTSPLQVLYALRDAIAGHQRLCGDDIRILHRDISHNNVLLGKQGAPAGERGILIDLDMAFKVTSLQPTVPGDHNVGTRLFQSISVLGSAILKERSLPYDHIEELESFFYLMTYIFLLFKPDGTRVARNDVGPSLVWAWGADDPEKAAEAKSRFRMLSNDAGRSNRLIRESWGTAFGALFQSLLLWVIERAEDKFDIFSDHISGITPQSDASACQEFYARRGEHYAAVLQMFDEAIDQVKTSTASGDESSLAKPTLIKPPTPPTEKGASEVTATLPDALAANGANTETPKPPTDVGAVASAAPASPVAPAPPRRSTRIQENRLQTDRRCQVPAVAAPRSGKDEVSLPSIPTETEPRRSARIQKRLLDEECTGGPQPKVRRTTKRSRRTTRPR